MSSESTSSSLLERLRDQDATAWSRLSGLYAPLVYRWARLRGLQSSDAADVTQEVFLAVFGNIHRFRHDRPSDSFRGWLWTITRNTFYEYHRRRGGQPEAAGGTAAYEALQATPELSIPLDDPSFTGFDAESGVVRRALDLVRAEFEDTTWRAFWRTAVDGQRAADVAAELEMTAAAVYMAKSRVFRRLRTELDGLFD